MENSYKNKSPKSKHQHKIHSNVLDGVEGGQISCGTEQNTRSRQKAAS